MLPYVYNFPNLKKTKSTCLFSYLKEHVIKKEGEFDEISIKIETKNITLTKLNTKDELELKFIELIKNECNRNFLDQIIKNNAYYDIINNKVDWVKFGQTFTILVNYISNKMRRQPNIVIWNNENDIDNSVKFMSNIQIKRFVNNNLKNNEIVFGYLPKTDSVEAGMVYVVNDNFNDLILLNEGRFYLLDLISLEDRRDQKIDFILE
jgi:hypothetical protein